MNGEGNPGGQLRLESPFSPARSPEGKQLAPVAETTTRARTRPTRLDDHQGVWAGNEPRSNIETLF